MKVGIEQLELSPLRLDRTIPVLPIAYVEQIRQFGQEAPVVVRPLSRVKYEILSNVEAWLAVQRLGVYQVEIHVRDPVSDDEARLMVNAGSGTDPVTEAEWFQAALQGPSTNGRRITVTSIAELSGVSRSYVAHSLRLLSLSTPIQEVLREGLLCSGHAKALLSLEDLSVRESMAARIVRERWSVRRAEVEARALRADGATVAIEPASEKLPSTITLERQLSELIGCAAEIDEQGGSLTIDYRGNLDVLDGVLMRLGYQG